MTDVLRIIDNENAILHLNGMDYDLNEWVTATEYAKRYRLKTTSVVTNWIRRGIIPEDSIIVVPQFNDLRLIKDEKYRK